METIILTWLDDGGCALICGCGQSQRLTHKPRTWNRFEFLWLSSRRFRIRCRACHAHIERFVSQPRTWRRGGLTVGVAALSGCHHREWTR